MEVYGGLCWIMECPHYQPLGPTVVLYASKNKSNASQLHLACTILFPFLCVGSLHTSFFIGMTFKVTIARYLFLILIQIKVLLRSNDNPSSVYNCNYLVSIWSWVHFRLPIIIEFWRTKGLQQLCQWSLVCSPLHNSALFWPMTVDVAMTPPLVILMALGYWIQKWVLPLPTQMLFVLLAEQSVLCSCPSCRHPNEITEHIWEHWLIQQSRSVSSAHERAGTILFLAPAK